MSFRFNYPIARAFTRSAIGVIAGLTVLSGVCAANVLAAPRLAGGEGADPATIEPLYVRAPDAIPMPTV